jgi:hypothetical protein
VSVSPSRWDFPRGTPYLLGQIGLVGNGNVIAPVRENHGKTLPIRSNRISWKQGGGVFGIFRILGIHPYLLGQIGLVGNVDGQRKEACQGGACLVSPLPIRSNRISWKLFPTNYTGDQYTVAVPYLLGQIGLVGNAE